MISAPLRSRFGMTCRLDYYEAEDLVKIVERSAGLLGVAVEAGGAREIANRSRGTPRIANNLLQWCRDYAQVRAEGIITAETAAAALTMLDIDGDGLDGPVGLNSLAVAVGEESGTLEEVHEPFLIMRGYLQRTPQGRTAMPLAYRKLGAVPPSASGDLFAQ
jgi:Holliday junction DNA helicase RuvB